VCVFVCARCNLELCSVSPSVPGLRLRRLRPTVTDIVGKLFLPRFNPRCVVVEAAGVEPASENVTGQETTCLVQFMLPAFTGNVRGRRSERTRNAYR